VQSGTGDGTESRRAANLALYHWNLIILVYPRVTLLSCAFEHFTRHLERSALCSRSMKLAISRMKRRVRRRRTVCSSARRFPLTLRVVQCPTVPRHVRFARVCLLPTPLMVSFTRAHATLRTILHARDLRHSVRCPNCHGRCETGRPIYIQDSSARHSVVLHDICRSSSETAFLCSRISL